jgi:hypothetical protein
LPGTTRRELWLSRIFDSIFKEQNLLHHAGLMVRDGSGAVSGAAAGLIVVVPANAGTHTPRPLDFGRKELLPPANIKPCGYGPLRSQGRRLRVVAAELVPLHLSNSPPCAGTASRSRRTFRAGFALSFRPLVNRGRRECRVMASPMARLQQKSRRQSPQVQPDQPAFPAQWF